MDRRQSPVLKLQESTRQTVGRLVKQLDNLPLAIELAAARLNIFNVDEIEQRLKERFFFFVREAKEHRLYKGLWIGRGTCSNHGQKQPFHKGSHGGFEIKVAEDVLRVENGRKARRF